MIASGWREQLRSWRSLIPVLLVAFPLLRLLPLDGHFYWDWYNHKWLIAYGGEYLRQHGSVPIVVNTSEHAGMPYPIFYGTLFYPLMSTLTLWINPGIALRMVVVLVTWLQFWMICSAFARIDIPLWGSRAIACLVIWAIYPLTNLYNRGAITEYVATGLLTCTLASWFLLIHARSKSDRRRIGLGFGLLFALVAGTHPITALYSLPILALLLIAAYDEHGRNREFWRTLVKSLVLPVVLTVIVLAPWVSALRRFDKHLSIHRISAGMPWFYTESIDHWSTRFFPVPYDSRTNETPLSQLPTPFLDAQINIPLLILVLGLVAIFMWHNRGTRSGVLRSIIIGMLAFAFFTWISLSPASFDMLPSFARLLQIAYRAVTYQNLALLLAVFMLAGFVRRQRVDSIVENKPLVAGLMLGCLVVSGTGVLIKWMHASAVMQIEGSSGLTTQASERQRWISVPARFYGPNDYSTPSLYPRLTDDERGTLQEVRMPVGIASAFGIPGPLRLNLPNESWIATNVQAFPWNRLELDGAGVSRDRLRADSFRLVVRVPAGDHTLTLDVAPDAVWIVLRGVSFAVLALWFACLAYLSFDGRLKRRIAANESPGHRATDNG